MKKIPKCVQEIMCEYGMNKAELLRDNVYTLYCVDERGDVVPTGLPLLVVCKGDKAVVLSDEESEKF